MVVIRSIGLADLTEALAKSKVAMLLISMPVIYQTKEESVGILSNVVHLKSDLLFVVSLLDSNVLVHTVWGFDDHEFILVIVFNLVVQQLTFLWVLETLHSCSDLSRARDNVLGSTIDKVRVVWWDVPFMGVSLKLLVFHDVSDFNWHFLSFLGIGDIVLVVVDLNLVLSRHNRRLIDVDIASLLICGQNDLIINIEFLSMLLRILEDVIKMLCSLDVILGSPVFSADVRDSLVDRVEVVLSSGGVVIDVVVLLVWVCLVAMGLSDFKENLLLDCLIMIIWVKEHVLIISSRIEIVINVILL